MCVVGGANLRHFLAQKISSYDIFSDDRAIESGEPLFTDS